MKEVTTTGTLEFTLIERHVSDEELSNISDKEPVKKHMENAAKVLLDAEDIHVSNLKFFIRDEEDTNG